MSPSSLIKTPQANPEIGVPADSILSVQGVSKKFCRHLKRSYVYGLRDIFSEVIGRDRDSEHLRDREFWSVKDVSLEVKKGQSIGLVGVNGSGKSTLLRMISGLMKPDTGKIVVRGRLAALVALGTGFNPLLSGRENVFINMAILGLSRAEIKDRFQTVVDFAEVWEAIDAPVRTYSSGMRARLGFACAIFTEPDILLLDEVLAVGDAAFRAKCYRKLANMREQGTSFFLVSHNSNAVLNICNTAVFLKKGKVVMKGSAEEVVGEYEQSLLTAKSGGKKSKKAVPVIAPEASNVANGTNGTNVSTASGESNGKSESDVESNGDLKTQPTWSPEKIPVQNVERSSEGETTELTIDRFYFVNADNEPVNSLSSGEPATLCIYCIVHEPIENAIVNVVVRELNAGNNCTLNINSERDKIDLPLLTTGHHEIRLHLPYCGLAPNIYATKITLSRRPFYVFDMVGPYRFEVKRDKNMNQCQFYQPREWQLPS